MSDLQINSLYVTRHNSSTPIMLYQADWRPIVVDIHTQLVNAQAGKAYTITLDVFDFENGRSIYKASHSFSLMEDELLESTAASFQRRKVLINMNWQPKTEIPFIMAHEIAHVLNGDDGTRYYESATIHSKVEYQANLTAVEILLNYCHNLDIEASNPVHLCENFGIPTALEYVVREQVQTYHVSRHRKAQVS